jgi:CheY-like chemotaxis protein
VVEDSEVRHEWFRHKLRGLSYKIAETPDKAVELIKSEHFDIVFLDHDSGISMVLDHTDPMFLENTFWKAAQQLDRDEFKGEILIHSGNPIGAKRMYNLLIRKCHPFIGAFGSFDIKVGNE